MPKFPALLWAICKYFRLLWVLCRYRSKHALFRYARLHTFSGNREAYLKFAQAYDEMSRDLSGIFRESGAPYMSHIHAVTVIIVVYLKIPDINEIIAAVLHDANEQFEETWNFASISRFHNRITAGYVIHISKPPLRYFSSEHEMKRAYHSGIHTAELPARRVKTADRIDNVITLYFCSPEKQLRKIRETEQYYIPWIQKDGILYDELRVAMIVARALCLFTRIFTRA